MGGGEAELPTGRGVNNHDFVFTIECIIKTLKLLLKFYVHTEKYRVHYREA